MFVHARGARKPKSKFLACAQIFTYADYVLAEGRGFYSVNQAEIIESFYYIRKDYDCLAAAYSITEICEKTLLEDMPADDLLLLALKALSHLSKGSFPALQISNVFLIRFITWYGLSPETENCGICGKPLEEMGSVLLTSEGVRCTNHSGNDDAPLCLKISASAAYALRHIVTSGMPQSFSFKAADDVLAELQRIGRLLWNSHF